MTCYFLTPANYLRQDPRSAFSLVHLVFEQGCGGNGVLLVADAMCKAKEPGKLAIVGTQRIQHILGATNASLLF
jgi:hypothetical protein